MLRILSAKALLAAFALLAVAVLGGCGQYSPDYMKPLSPEMRALIAQKGMREQAPITIRVFKEESVLEVWKQKDDGRYYFLKSYPICNYSGELGPKLKQGDRQAPEGFYIVSKNQMNPRSKYHLAFNIGFPNAYDRAWGRTGSNIMVHGDCKSAGCYAMTDALVEEIYILAREALAGGQEYFMIQAYPFKMTSANMAKHRGNKWYGFWQNLKQGYDYFETTRQIPEIQVCNRSYLINAVFNNPRQRPDPSRPCPAYRRLPVRPFSPAPAQTAENKQSSIKPLGSALGLAFGPREPTYHMFTLGPADPRPASSE
ncbi:MAG: L,D-transpeptidase family protein [Methyloligella sp. ZOD6]